MSAETSPAGEADSSNESDANSSTECPTCGDTFKNENAVKIHHTKIHNESIAGVEVECSWCGETLRRKKYRVKDYDEQFCGRNCQGEYYDENMEGENAVRWKGGKEKRECVICGGSFRARPARDTKLCSRECHGKYISQIQSGDGHPNWKGGKINYYGKNWQQQREKARERDEYKCQDCGVCEQELQRQLDVHHIKPLHDYRDGSDDEWWKGANKLNNLITLCQSCHKKWEGIPLAPQ